MYRERCVHCSMSFHMAICYYLAPRLATAASSWTSGRKKSRLEEEGQMGMYAYMYMYIHIYIYIYIGRERERE